MYTIGPMIRKKQIMTEDGHIITITDFTEADELSVLKDNRKPNKQIKDKNKKIRG